MQPTQPPAVGMNFDIGHSYSVSDDPATTIPRVAKSIRHFHLEDIAATRVHHHLIPGEGAIDFAAAFRAIRGIGYGGGGGGGLYPPLGKPPPAAPPAPRRGPGTPPPPLGRRAPPPPPRAR